LKLLSSGICRRRVTGAAPKSCDGEIRYNARGFEAAPFFNEFAVRVRSGNAASVCRKLEQQGMIAGFDLGRVDQKLADRLLIAVTEQHRREDLDRLVLALSQVA